MRATLQPMVKRRTVAPALEVEGVLGHLVIEFTGHWTICLPRWRRILRRPWRVDGLRATTEVLGTRTCPLVPCRPRHGDTLSATYTLAMH